MPLVLFMVHNFRWSKRIQWMEQVLSTKHTYDAKLAIQKCIIELYTDYMNRKLLCHIFQFLMYVFLLLARPQLYFSSRCLCTRCGISLSFMFGADLTTTDLKCSNFHQCHAQGERSIKALFTIKRFKFLPIYGH